MKVTKKETFSVLEDEKNDLKNFASFLQHLVPREFVSENIVVNLLPYGELKLDELLLFLQVSNNHRKHKKTFVLLALATDSYIIPEELIVVPTLQEAADIVEMEEIERDLGF